MPNILVFCGGGIGDVMMTTPMLRAIKTSWPDATLSVAVRQTVAIQLLEDNPFVDELLDMNEYTFIQLVRAVKSRGFAYCFHNHSCQSIVFYAVPFLSRIPVRIGFNRYLIKSTWINRLKPLLLTERLTYVPDAELRSSMNLKLLAFVDIVSDTTDYDLFIEDKSVQTNVVGIHPGCDKNGSIKRWPIKRFVELAERIGETGASVVFFIGPAEAEMLPQIRTSEFVSVSKPKSLKDLICQMSTCRVFIANDNGPAHLAAALKVPTMVIYGPTRKTEFVLPTRYIGIEPIGYDCTKCFREKECYNHSACLNSISVSEVMNQYMGLSTRLKEED